MNIALYAFPLEERQALLKDFKFGDEGRVGVVDDDDEKKAWMPEFFLYHTCFGGSILFSEYNILFDWKVVFL